MNERTLEVDYLARVEGEGALKVRIAGDRVEAVELRLFEPPRFFEALLVGRDLAEAPDITARICGICPVAYQMSATHAMEAALGVRVGPAIRALRRLLYCGEWIESHGLHIFLLHAPDFLGVPDAIALARDHPEIVRRGLALKQVGNRILQVLGGREVHPINVRVGGFYRSPSREDLEALRPALVRALDDAEATVRWTAGLSFPEIEEDYEFVALGPTDEYPMNEGPVVSSRGLSIPAAQFEEEFLESQVPYSHALQATRRGGGAYLVGPLARYALHASRLSPRARSLAREVGLPAIVRNPYQSIVVRSLEVLYAVEESLRILEGYVPPDPPFVACPPPGRPVDGAAVTEAPRGILYHHYRLAADGRIESATIVPPTSQNQKRIEEDLRHLIGRSLAMDDVALTGACERAIRNHDPCISCATHFLEVDVERR